MANGVHATVKTMQPPPPQPPVDGVTAQPECNELRTRHNPVLPPRETRNRRIEGVLFHSTAHYAAKWKSPPNSPPRCPSFGRHGAGGRAPGGPRAAGAPDRRRA